jgi:hypothetical protein
MLITEYTVPVGENRRPLQYAFWRLQMSKITEDNLRICMRQSFGEKMDRSLDRMENKRVEGIMNQFKKIIYTP